MLEWIFDKISCIFEMDSASYPDTPNIFPAIIRDAIMDLFAQKINFQANKAKHYPL